MPACLPEGPVGGSWNSQNTGEHTPVGHNGYLSPRQPLAQEACACNNNRSYCFSSLYFVSGPV